MYIEERYEGDGVLNLKITGDIRFQTLIPFREKIVEIEDGLPGDLVIDMSGVDNIDSSAIGLLIRLYKHQKEISKLFKIKNPTTRVLELLKFSSLADVID